MRALCAIHVPTFFAGLFIDEMTSRPLEPSSETLLIISINSHMPNIALLSTCGQRTAYHITKIVDADDVVARVVHRLIARQIGFAEDRRRAIERFIHVDELDYLALGIENGAYGTRAVILLYVCRDADIVGPALNEDRGGAADFLHDLVNQGEVVIHLRRAKKYRRDSLTVHRISAFDFRGS